MSYFEDVIEPMIIEGVPKRLRKDFEKNLERIETMSKPQKQAEIVTLQQAETLPAHSPHQPEAFNDEQKQLIKSLYGKDLTATEFQYFLFVATKRGLNPLLNQIYAIKRGDKMTLQVSIEGLRIIAERTGKRDQTEKGYGKTPDGKIYAWAKVYRKDWKGPAYEEVYLEEYKGSSPIWTKMPLQMLKKCAEAAALRLAFPEDMGGLYTSEEMSQAGGTPDALLEVTEVDLEEESRQAMLKMLLEVIKTHNITKEQFSDITGMSSIKEIQENNEAISQALSDVSRWIDTQG